MRSDVCVVIVAYNTRDDVLRCLASLATGARRTSVQVVVVDNGSHDGTAEAVRAQHPEVLVDEAGSNLGFAVAVNRAAALGDSEHVLLLNPDTVVRPHAIDELVDFARRHPEHGLYGGRTFTADGSVLPSSCWGAMSVWSLFCFASGLSSAFPGHPRLDPESLGPWRRDTVREVPVITGCLLLARRETWQDLGGFDETYFLYGEDADLSARAWRHGWRPVLVPTAGAVHAVGTSSSSASGKMRLVLAGKATLVRRSWAPVRGRVGLALLQAGVGVRALGEVAVRRRPGMWTGSWQARADWAQGYPHALVLVPDATRLRQAPRAAA